MTNLINFVQPPQSVQPQADVEFFDPPMCCPTGLCGPNVDQTPLDVNEMLERLKAQGVTIERYQMTSHPYKFIGTPAIMQHIQEKQMDALPITLVRGQVIKVGTYPTEAEIEAALAKVNPS